MRKYVLTIFLVILAGLGANTVKADLVAHWELNGDANDSAGSNHGTIYGDPQWTGGVFDQALNFDGIGDYIQGSTSPFNFEDTTFTVATWCKTTTGGILVSEGGYEGGYEGGWNFSVNEGNFNVGLKSYASGKQAYSAITEDTFNDGNWHHVAAIITTSTADASGNHADVYVDGQLVNITETKSRPYGGTSLSWRIGARHTVPVYFDGMIDDVRIYNHALTEQQIAEIIPEPATLLLFGFGSLALLRKRRA